MISNNLQTGRKTGIGPSGVPISDLDLHCVNGIVIYADTNNSGVIWVGNNGFTMNSGDITDGFPISAGDVLTLDHRNPENIYVASPLSGQTLWWILQ